MFLKKSPLEAIRHPAPPLLVLGFLMVLRPLLPVVFPESRNWMDELVLLILGTALVTVLVFHGFSFRGLGVTSTHCGNHAVLGAGAGLLVLLIPPILDSLVDATALAEGPLFLGAGSRPLDKAPLTLWAGLEHVLLLPLVTQAFAVGWLLSPWAGRLKTPTYLALAGLVFPLVLWSFSAGTALLGMISALFFRETGSLTAPLIFHISCAMSGLLVTYVYPRVVTLLGFLL